MGEWRGVAVSEQGRGGAGDWRRGVVVAVTAQLLSVMGFSCFFSFLPLFVQTLGIASPTRAAVWSGLMTFGQAMMVAVFSPIWGSIADRYGGKPMVQRALFGGGTVFIAISLAGRVEVVLLLFFVLGCLTGVNTAIVTMVANLVPQDRLGTAIGACQTGVFVGASVGPTVGGIIADAFSYRAGIRSGAVLMLCAGLLIFFGIREPVRPGRAAGRRVNPLAGLRAAGMSRVLWLLIAMIFLIQFSTQMMSPVLAIYVQELAPSADRVATLVGVVLGVGGVTAALGAFIWGRAADRYGQGRVLGWTTSGGAITIGAQALAASIPPLVALRGLSGLFTGGLSSSTNAAIGQIVPPSSRGAAFGVAGSSFSLGNAFGPLLGGLLAESIGARGVVGLSALALVGGWALSQVLVRQGDAARRRTEEGASPAP